MTAELYAVSIRAINHHLKRIFSDNALESEATVEKYSFAQTEGKRQVQFAAKDRKEIPDPSLCDP